MLKRFAQLAGLTLLLGVVFAPAARASTHFSVWIGPSAPFAPGVAAFGPPPGYVWQPGYRVWTGFGYRWVPGAWVRALYARGNWAGERWEREHRDRDFDRDRHWNHDRDRRDWDRDRRDWDRDERGHWRR